jgi:MFS family permease
MLNPAQSHKWWILSVVTLVAFVTNVDGTIVVVGLPRMVSGLHTTITVGLWALTSYIITSTVFLLPAGRWSDVIGSKKIFMFGLLVFTVATLLCGIAPSGALLIAFRFIQGAGAALALATATPIIVRAFPQAELGRALGINSTAWVMGSIVGPVAGGVLVSTLGWRAIFFVTILRPAWGDWRLVHFV